MGHHIDEQGRFQSDKHRDLKPDKVIIDLTDPLAFYVALMITREYGDADPEFAADIETRVRAIQAQRCSELDDHRWNIATRMCDECGITREAFEDQPLAAKRKATAKRLLLEIIDKSRYLGACTVPTTASKIYHFSLHGRGEPKQIEVALSEYIAEDTEQAAAEIDAELERRGLPAEKTTAVVFGRDARDVADGIMFSYGVGDLRGADAPAIPAAFTEGERVLHRRRDMFAKLTVIDSLGSRGLCKYEWPYKADADAEWVPLDELEPAAGLNPDGTRDY